MFVDKKFRSARKWSNLELKKFSHFLKGDVVNVSAYLDQDKEGKTYQRYFSQATTYSITNFDSDKKGLTGLKDEIYTQICEAYILKYKPGEDIGIDDVTISEEFVNEES